VREETIGPIELRDAGLYEPAAADAAERLALLQYLLALGATLDDLVEPAAGSLPELAASIALWGGRERLTIDELSDASGVERNAILRAWRAAGFPDPGDRAAFTRRDVEVFQLLGVGADYLGEDRTEQLVRVLGATAGRIAETLVSMFIVDIATETFERDPSGLELAQANAQSVALIDSVTRALDMLVRHNVERGFRRVNADPSVHVDVVTRSIGFADLVDSTQWAQQFELGELSRVLSRFDSLVTETVVANGGRVVKLIGDEVMFIAHDPAEATLIALALLDELTSDEALPTLRAGVATGSVVTRDGDYDGPVVNLAARAVKRASPNTVFVDEQTSQALDEERFDVFALGNFNMKGFGDLMPLFHVSRR
jgi:adenylate cyclase